MKTNWSQSDQPAKPDDQLSEDIDEDQDTCNWLDELPRQGPVTLTPFDKQLWESLLGDNNQCRGHTSNGNNHGGGTASTEAHPVADQTTPTFSRPDSSGPAANNGLSRIRFRTNAITQPANLPEDSPLVQANITCHDQFRANTPPQTMSRASPVSNWAVEACQRRWSQATVAPPERAERKVEESALNTSNINELAGNRRTQSSVAASPRLGISGIEVMLSSVGTGDDSAGSTPDDFISTMGVTDSTASRTPQSVRFCRDDHTISDDPDCRSCYRSRSKSKCFHSDAVISNVEQQNQQVIDCTGCPNSLPLSNTRQPWQLTTSRRRLFVGQNAPVPRDCGPQAPPDCPPFLWKKSALGADGRSAPAAVSTEVTMEFSGDSSDEAECSPTRVRLRSHRLPARFNSSAKRRILPASRSSAAPATVGTSLITGAYVAASQPAFVQPPQELGQRFPATSEGPTTVAKSNYSDSKQSLAADKPLWATAVSDSKTVSTRTEQSESTLCPSDGQDAPPGNLLSGFSRALESCTSLMRIGVNEAVTDDSMARSIQPISPQQYCARAYEVLGFYGAPGPKDIPGIVSLAQADGHRNTVASRIQPRKSNSWNSTGCHHTKDCLKPSGSVWRNRCRRCRRASLLRVSHAMIDATSGGCAEWVCVTGDQTGDSQSGSNSGSAAAVAYESGGDLAEAPAWTSARRLLRSPRLPLTEPTPRLHTAHALLRHKAGSGCVAPVRAVEAGQRGCVAAVRLCSADHGRFVWLAGGPTRHSRTCCQLLSGPLDNCQPGESGLVMSRSPVYAHLHASFGLAVSSVDRQPVASSVRVAAPLILTALRYVTPGEAPDAWSPSPCLEGRDKVPSIECAKVPLLPWLQPLSGAIRRAEPAFIPTGTLLHTSSSSSEPLHSTPPIESAAFADHTGHGGCSSSKAQQHRELRRIVRMRMQRKVRQDEVIDIPCCSLSTSDAEDPPCQQCQPGLQKRLGGLLESLRDSQQIAAVIAASLTGGSLSQKSQGWRSDCSSLVQRILRESSSQQAAIRDLLVALQGDTGECCTGDEERHSCRSAQSAATSVGTAGSPLSEQFFSLATAGPSDAFSRASGPAPIGFVASPKTDANSQHRSISMNNNAESTSNGTTLSAGGLGNRHQTFYARRCIVRLEESAALLVQEASCRASSVVSVCSVHQDDSEENSSCASSAVQAASVAAQQRTQRRLLALQRLTLAQAWLKPPVSDRFLYKMDPTVASFIWWSLLPLHRRLRPLGGSAPDASNGDPNVGVGVGLASSSSSPPFQAMSEMEVCHESMSASASESEGTAIGAPVG